MRVHVKHPYKRDQLKNIIFEIVHFLGNINDIDQPCRPSSVMPLWAAPTPARPASLRDTCWPPSDPPRTTPTRPVTDWQGSYRPEHKLQRVTFFFVFHLFGYKRCETENGPAENVHWGESRRSYKDWGPKISYKNIGFFGGISQRETLICWV